MLGVPTHDSPRLINSLRASASTPRSIPPRAIITTPTGSNNLAQGCPSPRGLPWVSSQSTNPYRAQRGERSEYLGKPTPIHDSRNNFRCWIFLHSSIPRSPSLRLINLHALRLHQPFHIHPPPKTKRKKLPQNPKIPVLPISPDAPPLRQNMLPQPPAIRDRLQQRITRKRKSPRHD
jgi:hypothetical protein